MATFPKCLITDHSEPENAFTILKLKFWNKSKEITPHRKQITKFLELPDNVVDGMKPIVKRTN